MASLGSVLGNLFSFFGVRTTKDDQVMAYILREHARGRRISEILEDRYVQNRLSPEQQARLLERPDVVHALGAQDIDAARELLASRRA
jgi:hypothetical protein